MGNQNSKKGFSVLAISIILISIIILVVTGIATYNYFYQTQSREKILDGQDQILENIPLQVDETASWETYSNYDFNFQIKYPPSWSINTISEVKDRINFIAPAPPVKIFDFEIRIQKNSEKLSSKDFVQNLLQKNKSEKNNKISYKASQDLIIAGFPAYELKEVFVNNQNQEWIYMATNDYVYFFAFPVAEENPNLQDPITNNKISHLMLSTFVFMEGTKTKEDGCIASGGKVSAVTCYCSGSENFYNSCIVGGCNCSPDPKYAKEVNRCECPIGKCFNGIQCVNQQ